MRIEKIILKNYRQFKDAIITFDTFEKNSGHDIYVLIGLMGTGKTNLLNAINWCLYGDEPYLSNKSQNLPLLNVKSIGETKSGEDKKVVVELLAKSNGNRISFKREETYRVYEMSEMPKKQNTTFEVYKVKSDGSTQIIEKPRDARNIVERFVPNNIREFFFFDGERLDKYFVGATGQNIRKEISLISRIELLNRVYNKLDEIRRGAEKSATKSNPKTNDLREKIKQKDKECQEKGQEIEELMLKIEESKRKLEEQQEELSQIPDVEKLEIEMQRLLSQKKQKEEGLNLKIKEKEKVLFDNGIIVMLWEAIKKALQMIGDKRNEGQMPPEIDKKVLEKTIQDGLCCICGKKLDDEAQRKVENLLKSFNLSSKVTQHLASMELLLLGCIKKLEAFNTKLNNVMRDIEEYQKDIMEIENKIKEIEEQIIGYDVCRLKELYKIKKLCESSYKENIQRLGILKMQKQQLEDEKDSLQKQLFEELKKEKKLKELTKKISFLSKAQQVLKETREKIMNDIRLKIEDSTKKYFFDIMWKKESFADLHLDDDYKIELIHAQGYDCLGTLSGGEREALTLAFTMALHQVSGFDAPIIVDRPLAMVSGEARANIVKALLQISKQKQVILFFTTDDYSADISDILDNNAAKRYRFYMSSDEKETTVEVL
ncbi:MAG: sulfur modification protein DndD [Thermoanaerobacterium sp.]|nr:sulfur modification protein DndD [Thermoanaerobacterium sp.]MDN5346211.1 sulfur modification protein DndD [Petrotoga sp.]HCF38759.1 hypothetical protein [Thermosipho africanus]